MVRRICWLMVLGTLASAQGHTVVWSGRKFVAGRATGAAPAVAVVEGRMHLVYRGRKSNHLYHSVFRAGQWTPETQILAGESRTTPALAVDGAVLHMVYAGAKTGHLYHSMYRDGRWKPEREIPGRMSRHGPGLAAWNGRLHMVHRGYKSENLYYSTYSAGAWSPERRIAGWESSHTPSLAVFQGKLQIAVLGGGKSTVIWHATHNGRSWDAPIQIAVKSIVGPHLVVHADRLYLFGTQKGGRIFHASFDGRTWTGATAIAGQACNGTPAVVETTDDDGEETFQLLYRDVEKHAIWHSVGYFK